MNCPYQRNETSPLAQLTMPRMVLITAVSASPRSAEAPAYATMLRAVASQPVKLGVAGTKTIG